MARDWPASMGLGKGLLFSSKPSLALFSLATVVMLVMVYLTSWGDSTQQGYISTFTAAIIPLSLRSAPLNPPVKKLMEALQESIQTVVENSGVNPNTPNPEQWRRENSCRSRTELMSLYQRLHSPARQQQPLGSSPQWEVVLQEYAKLHRACTSAAGNLTEYFYTRNTSTGCKFVIADAKTGMGNKVLLMTSTIVYAVLTQRVILIPISTSIPGIMCEPFLGSTWKLPHDLQDRSVGMWKQTQEFMEHVDQAKVGGTSNDDAPFYAARVDDDWQPVSRFFCDMEQAYLTQVTWLSVIGSLYFLPKLFAIPSYRATLEALFPNPSLALTQMLRTFMLPADKIWDRVKGVEGGYLDKKHTQVGIQARYFGNREEGQELHKVVNSNVVGCLLEKRILQEALFLRHTPKYAKLQHQTTLFIASLTTGLHDYLHSTYVGNLTDNTIRLTQLSHEEEQRAGSDVCSQALLEVIHLSLSHTLLITPKSTFGGLAQAYGAMRPWFIETRQDSIVPCVLAQTVDVCYQIPDVDYKCPYEPRINMKHIMEFVPYIRYCLDVDVGRSGIQLVGRLFNRTMSRAR